MVQARENSRAAFLQRLSYQKAEQDPFSEVTLSLQFIQGPRLSNGSMSALFVEAFHVGESWIYGDPPRVSPFHDPTIPYPNEATDRVYALQPATEFADLQERVLIDWGAAARRWVQWAGKGKPVVALRLEQAGAPLLQAPA